ncbi:uncharacterized protein [Solanum tuberosum]|uniref:uncharacterized protein n=1 Tax=Solanum tuberosum TaxID=4113 RepID=UPI00073A2BF5|nr:PREDICTED: uncharacterized protein LOC107058121 [Solanum tuberosum]
MAMLWWRRKEAEIGKGSCTINTWEKFREEFKKAFFPNNCPELKSLGAILRERKEKGAQEQEQGEGTTQLGLIGLCGAITKQPEKLKGCGVQYVDLKINGKPACALVDTGAEVNLMTKKAATRLGLSYSPSSAQLRTVNAPPTPVNGVAHGVSITLGEWQGKTNFTVAPVDLFDIILGQEFFQQCHAAIDPHLQRLLVMEQGRSCMVHMVQVPKTEGQVRLTAMQLERRPKKKEPASRATIASSKKDNGAKGSLPPRMKKVPKGNNAVMPKKPPRRLPPKKEDGPKSELETIWKTMKALRKGLDRVNGLLVAHAQGSDDNVAVMRRGRRINRWGRMSRPATSQ